MSLAMFPDGAAVMRWVGAILPEQSDDWATQRSRYVGLEAISTIGDTGLAGLSAVPA